MGVIDPMLIGNAAATGVLEVGNTYAILLPLVGVLGGTVLGIVLSAVYHVRAVMPALPWLGHEPLVALGVARVK